MTKILAIDGAATAGFAVGAPGEEPRFRVAMSGALPAKLKRRASEARRFASVGAGDVQPSSAIVKRRPLQGRRFEGASDVQASPVPAPDYGDLAGDRQPHHLLVAGRESGLAPGSFPRGRP